MWRIGLIVACLLWLSLDACHAAPPPCAPFQKGTSQTVSPRAWQYEVGAEGMHVWWWCKDTAGVETPWSLYCSTRWVGDCNIPALISFVAKKLNYQTEWGRTVIYTCDDKATREGADWKGALCREHSALYLANKQVWEK
jgi:hypothetical protein